MTNNATDAEGQDVAAGAAPSDTLVVPQSPQGQENDWKSGYSFGFEAAKALFAPAHWQEAAENVKRLEWLSQQAGATLHEPIEMLGTISERKSWLIVDAFGDELGKGDTLQAAIDDGRARGKDQGSPQRSGKGPS